MVGGFGRMGARFGGMGIAGGHVVVPFDATAPFTKYAQPGIWVKDFDYSRAAASGLSRIYQESANQTLVSAATQVIGFVLDDSQGAAIGAAVLSDDFSYADVTAMVAAGWNGYDHNGASFVVDDTALSLVSGRVRTTNPVGRDFASAVKPFTAVVGTWYRIVVTNTQVTAASRVVQIGTSPAGSGVFNSSSFLTAGAKSGIFRATATTLYVCLQISTGTDGNATEWDDLTITPVAGNHLIQATSGQRGTLQELPTKVWRGDGVDDSLLAALSPAAATTMFVRVKATIGGVYIAGTQASASTRFQLTCNATTGQLGAGVGSDGNTTITGGGDIQNVEGVAVLRADGTTVALWWFPIGGAISLLYSGAQNGTPTTTIPFRFGAINNNGTVGSTPLSGDLYKIFVVQAAMSDADVATMAAALAA